MWLELARRISVIVFIVAFATNSVVSAVQAHSHHTESLATVAMSTDDDGDCTYDKYHPAHQLDIQKMCCSAGAGVSVVLPASIGLYLADAQDALMPSLDRVPVGRTIPPDPHPPKQVALI